MKQIIREITPINNDDFFILLNHPNASFDFPTHYHYEYEINLVMNFNGKRIVGDSIENISGTDLVLIGPNTFHSWESTPDFHTHVITIQFFFEQELIQTNQRDTYIIRQRNSFLRRRQENSYSNAYVTRRKKRI